MRTRDKRTEENIKIAMKGALEIAKNALNTAIAVVIDSTEGQSLEAQLRKQESMERKLLQSLLAPELLAESLETATAGLTLAQEVLSRESSSAEVAVEQQTRNLAAREQLLRVAISANITNQQAVVEATDALARMREELKLAKAEAIRIEESAIAAKQQIAEARSRISKSDRASLAARAALEVQRKSTDQEILSAKTIVKQAEIKVDKAMEGLTEAVRKANEANPHVSQQRFSEGAAILEEGKERLSSLAASLGYLAEYQESLDQITKEVASFPITTAVAPSATRGREEDSRQASPAMSMRESRNLLQQYFGLRPKYHSSSETEKAAKGQDIILDKLIESVCGDAMLPKAGGTVTVRDFVTYIEPYKEKFPGLSGKFDPKVPDVLVGLYEHIERELLSRKINEATDLKTSIKSYFKESLDAAYEEHKKQVGAVGGGKKFLAGTLTAVTTVLRALLGVLPGIKFPSLNVIKKDFEKFTGKQAKKINLAASTGAIQASDVRVAVKTMKPTKGATRG